GAHTPRDHHPRPVPGLRCPRRGAEPRPTRVRQLRPAHRGDVDATTEAGPHTIGDATAYRIMGMVRCTGMATTPAAPTIAVPSPESWTRGPQAAAVQVGGTQTRTYVDRIEA